MSASAHPQPRHVTAVQRLAGLVFSLAATLGLSAPAGAQDYPNKPVRIIAPFPPGGSVDLVARLAAARLTESFGQQFVIDNRSGASGNIGTEAAARAAPDGYTLLVHTIPFVANSFLMARVPYDPLNDFAPVIQLSTSPSLLVVNPNVKASNVRELIALASTKPGALYYATAGIASNPHIAGELFNFMAKTEMTPVHFKGGGPALISIVGGEVNVGFANFSETAAMIRDGRLRALGVTAAKRAPALPNVPTVAEAGLPGYEFGTWQGLLAPRGTPPAVINLLNERLRRALSTPEQQKIWNDRGLDIVGGTPEQFAAHLRAEAQKWGRVIRERGMKAE